MAGDESLLQSAALHAACERPGWGRSARSCECDSVRGTRERAQCSSQGNAWRIKSWATWKKAQKKNIGCGPMALADDPLLSVRLRHRRLHVPRFTLDRPVSRARDRNSV